MTVTIPVPYRTYDELRRANTLEALVSTLCCERAACREEAGGASLVLTSTVVERTAIFLAWDRYGTLGTVRTTITICQVRCGICKSRFRLLPCDVPPHKLYTFAVIEFALVAYCGDVDRPFPRSLRTVVAQIHGDQTPSHTSLHGWSEGLGAYASGRPVGELRGAIPVSWLLGKTEELASWFRQARQAPARLEAAVREAAAEEVSAATETARATAARERARLQAAALSARRPEVPPVRYKPPRASDAEDAEKSRGRRERLQQLCMFLRWALTMAIGGQTGKPAGSGLAHWSMFVLERVQQPSWQFCFRSALGCTGSEHVIPRGSRDCRCRQRKARRSCPTRERSPPGGTNE